MKNTKKQRKYYVFTMARLNALVKMAKSQNGVIVLNMESAGHKYPGQLQLTNEFKNEFMEYWD